MNKLSDEILNEYIEGDLNPSEMTEVKNTLKESPEDRKRLNALLKIHNELKRIKQYEVGSEFTSLVMSKIGLKFKPKKSDKYFIVSISSFFILVSLIIFGFVISNLISSSSHSSSTDTIANNLVSYFKDIAVYVGKVFTGSGISIFGSIISLGILITAYFFFESHKNIKEIQNKL